MSERLNIVACAYACSPYRGSEPGVGWGWIRAIARHHHVHVLTAAFHRDEIEQYRAAHPRELANATFAYVPHKGWHFSPNRLWRRIAHSPLRPLVLVAYRAWLRDAYRLARRLHDKHRFDIAHHVTMVGFRYPGHFHKMPIPFVWGPIGGLENTPWRFLPAMGLRGTMHYAFRNVVNSLHKRCLQAPRRAMQAAAAIIAATPAIRDEIARCYGRDAVVMCEIVPPEPGSDAPPTPRGPGEPLRLCWSGQHVPGKALPLLLKALAQMPATIGWRLSVLGEGPSSRYWRRLAESLGVAERCRWLGNVSRDDALGHVAQSHVFVITSLKDLTSTVLLEALAMGVPVICPDHCGFSAVVDETCGVKLPIETPEAFSDALPGAILSLATNDGRRQALARGASLRACAFSVNARGVALDSLYRSLTTTTYPECFRMDPRAGGAVSTAGTGR